MHPLVSNHAEQNNTSLPRSGNMANVPMIRFSFVCFTPYELHKLRIRWPPKCAPVKLKNHNFHPSSSIYRSRIFLVPAKVQLTLQYVATNMYAIVNPKTSHSRPFNYSTTLWKSLPNIYQPNQVIKHNNFLANLVASQVAIRSMRPASLGAQRRLMKYLLHVVSLQILDLNFKWIK